MSNLSLGFAYSFYRAALNARRSSREKSVCMSIRPSVRLSVKRVDCDKTEQKLSRFSYYTERSFSFLKRRMVSWGDTFYLKFWLNRPPSERNRRFWTDITRFPM